jgi:hypothetical protein
MMPKGRFVIFLVAAISLQSPLAVAQTTSNSLFYSFTDRGGVSIQTIGGTGPITVGYARLDPGGGTTAPTGVEIFAFRPNGVTVAESAVPAMLPMLSGRAYAEVSSRINTGMAFVNPNSFQVTISFFFTDQSGIQSGQGTFSLDPGVQIARFLNEAPFSLINSSFVGTFSFIASAPVGVISLRSVLNERNDFLITTQTVAPTVNASATPLVMAHFADGGGWRTQVLLVNPTDSPISGSVQFFGPGSSTTPATPLTLSVNGQTAAAFNYTILSRSSVNLTTAGFGTATQTGSVQVTPTSGSNAPSGFAVFSFSSNGVTVSQASVAAQPVATIFRTYVETSGTIGSPGSIDSGIAIANTSTTPATVNLDLTFLNGTSTGLSTLLTIPALGHVSAFVSQLFPTLVQPSQGSFQGVLRINASITPIALVGLRTRNNERGDFLITTLPATNELSNSTTAELLFPHFVNMGGYTTQFILFSGVQYQSALGTLNFFNQNGQPVNLTFH